MLFLYSGRAGSPSTAAPSRRAHRRAAAGSSHWMRPWATRDPGALRALIRRCGVNCQQLRYSIPGPAAEPAFRRDREVLHIFFRRGEAAARAGYPVGVVHETETKLRARFQLEPRERLEIRVIRAVARDRHVDQLDRASDSAGKLVRKIDHVP